jgi:hypothetical protein
MVARKIRGESVLVPIARTMDDLNSIISLNETAEFIRAEAAQGLHEDAICAHLMNEYEVDEEAARRDVQAVLAELVSIGALQPETIS